MRELIKEARNVNEAIDLACEELGVLRDDIQFEILTLPKKGLLGIFGNTLAKVKVIAPDVKPSVQTKSTPSAIPKEKKPEPVKKEKTAAPEMKKQDKPKRERVEQAVKPKTDAPLEKRLPDKEQLEALQPTEFVDMSNATPREKLVCDYVLSVLQALGAQTEIKLGRTEKGTVFQLSGDGLGVIIGRRGETLDALQYLASLVGNRGEKDYMRVTLDSGNYREKREQTLQRLAKRIASNVLRSGRSTTLEAMNPYERRIIHATVSAMEGVVSNSVGEDPNRRVVISSTSPNSRSGSSRSGGRNQRSGNRSSGRNFRERGDRRDDRRRSSAPRDHRSENTMPVTSTDVDKSFAAMLEHQPVVRERVKDSEGSVAPVREKTSDEAGSLPLYGKIDV